MSSKIQPGPQLEPHPHHLTFAIEFCGLPEPFKTEVTPPRIKVHDLRPVAPSGVALASATTATDLDRTCLRAAEPDTWITQTLSSVPCDLFLVVGSNGTSVDQLECAGCTLRAAHLPDECLTWVPWHL